MKVPFVTHEKLLGVIIDRITRKVLGETVAKKLFKILIRVYSILKGNGWL